MAGIHVALSGDGKPVCRCNYRDDAAAILFLEVLTPALRGIVGCALLGENVSDLLWGEVAQNSVGRRHLAAEVRIDFESHAGGLEKAIDARDQFFAA